MLIQPLFHSVPIRRAAFLGGVALLCVAFGQTERMRNSDFSGGFNDRGIAEGWEDNSSWAPVTVVYASDAPGVDGGGSCEKIEVASFKGGAVQFVHGLLEPVGRYRLARVALSLKGEMKTPVEVQLRKRSHPYTTYITRSFLATPEWKALSFEEPLPDSAPDMIAVIRLTGTGSIWIDDFHVTDRVLPGPNPFTVLAPPSRPVPEAYFGQHTHNHRYPELTWPAVPFKQLRFWDSRTAWPWLEPRKGEWNFERLDRLVEACVASNVQILLTMGLTPQWASARPQERSAYTAQFQETGWAAEAAEMEDWRNYVRTVATRYKGRIRHYEMWNEPNNNVLPLAFFTGTHAKLAELCREAYAILKAVDPSNTVISPAVVGSAAYTDGFLRAGGKGTFDKLGYHFYTGYHSKSVYDRAPERSIAEVLRVKRVLADHGLAEFGLWNTEAGWYAESASRAETHPEEGKASEWVPLQEQGDLIARLYLLQWAQGVESFSFYAWDNGNMGLIEKDGAPKPGAIAYRTIQGWMVGSRMLSCRADEGENWIAEFRDPRGKAFRVVWREKGAGEIEVGAWGAGESCDLYGKRVPMKGARTLATGGSPLRIE